MGDLEFWGIGNDDQTMAEEWAGSEWIAAVVMGNEHRVQNEPAYTVTFRRGFETYDETMTISGYPGQRLIVVTHPAVTIPGGRNLPGVIRELPVGWRDMASAETFRSKFERVVDTYAGHGWTRK